MMKVIVINSFYDSEAKINRKKGDIVELSAKRINEINRKGRYIELCEDKAVTPTAKEKN